MVSPHSCCAARRKVRKMLTEDSAWTAKLLTASKAVEVYPDLLTQESDIFCIRIMSSPRTH